MNDKIRLELKRIKEMFAESRAQIQEISDSIKEPIDREYPLDLWSLSDKELDSEMAERLSLLNDDIDFREDIQPTSERKRFRGISLLYKKAVKKLISPYLDQVFERIQGKQVRFSEDLVKFHLATFIRIRKLDQRLAEIEEKLFEGQEALDYLLQRLSPEPVPEEPSDR